MRADRLLSILLLLQARGHMPAWQLAAELEVSIRTIYRDLDALSTAGVPVYAERGPGGGCGLVDSYRTNLTGLNEDEVRALFLLSTPTPLVELGYQQDLALALQKLRAALPAWNRREEERVRQRIHLDWEGWGKPSQPAAHLSVIRQAVWQDRKLEIRYRPEFFDFNVHQVVEPLGLVAKAGEWYLVYQHQGRVRAMQVRHILQAEMLKDYFERPPGFDVSCFWADYCQEENDHRHIYRVVVRISPRAAAALPHYLPGAIQDECEPSSTDETGWQRLVLAFDSLETARGQLLSAGQAVEVLEPIALRRSMLDYAEQIVQVYVGKGALSD